MAEETVITEAEKTGDEKIAEETAAAEKVAAEKVAAEKVAAGEKTPEEIAAEEKAAEEKVAADKKAAEKEEGAPETYTEFTMPEGVEVDKAAVEKFEPLARELNLSQENAQKLVDVYAEGAKQAAEAQITTWGDIKEGWVKEGKADKEIGGENYDQTVSDAKLALDKLGNEALGIVLETTGVGDNPDFLRMFAKVGRVLRDDNIDFGSGTGGETKEPGKVMYGDMS